MNFLMRRSEMMHPDGSDHLTLHMQRHCSLAVHENKYMAQIVIKVVIATMLA